MQALASTTGIRRKRHELRIYCWSKGQKSVLHVQSSAKQILEIIIFEVMITTLTYNCKSLIPCIKFIGVHSSLVLGYSLWDNRKIITSRQMFIFRSNVFIVFAVAIVKALYYQAMQDPRCSEAPGDDSSCQCS